jgi:hypothetical protein
MNELSQEQRTHLNHRLFNIVDEKLTAKRKELFGEGGPNTVTWGEMFEAIKNGDVTLKDDELDRTDAYLLSHHVTWPAREAKVKALADYQVELQAERQRIYDQFVFNNVAGVTDALAEFAKL